MGVSRRVIAAVAVVGVEPAADALARSIEIDQNIEIERMSTMLTARTGGG